MVLLWCFNTVVYGLNHIYNNIVRKTKRVIQLPRHFCTRIVFGHPVQARWVDTWSISLNLFTKHQPAIKGWRCVRSFYFITSCAGAVQRLYDPSIHDEHGENHLKQQCDQHFY